MGLLMLGPPESYSTHSQEQGSDQSEKLRDIKEDGLRWMGGGGEERVSSRMDGGDE